MDVSLIAARLKAEVPRARDVGQLAELSEAMLGSGGDRSIYVMPVSEKGDEIKSTGQTKQTELRVFSVLICVEARKTGGGDALDTLAELRGQIKAALIGWVPAPENGEPVLFAGGEVVELGKGRLWWGDDFYFRGYYRAAN